MTAGRSPLVLTLALACAGTGCGRSVREAEQVAGGAGGSAAATGAGGAAGTGGTTSTTMMLVPDAPMEARHVTVGAPVANGCLSSVVTTATGVRYAGKANPAAFAGIGELTRDARWTFSNVAPPNETFGSALVFGDIQAQVVAWPSNPTTGICQQFFDADGGLRGGSQTDAQGEPLAAFGTPAEFSLAFSYQNALSVMHFQNGNAVVIPVESEACVEPSSVAIGSFGNDVVLGYFCNRFVASEAAQHLVVARVKLATNEVERTVLDLPVGAPTPSGGAETGVPAAFWHDDELLFAHPTAEGALALTRVKASDLSVSSELVTGMPSAAINPNERNPVFSVVQVGDEIGLTRAACNGHEDALSTGAFDLCRISATSLEAVCSQLEEPCQDAKLIANGSDVTLLGCGGEAATWLPLELAAIPAEQAGFFPTGYSSFEPLALTCDGDACSALLELSSSRLITGHDARLAFADLNLAAGCSAATCRASTLEPTAVFTEWSNHYPYSPSVTVQRQLTGLPLGVVTLASDEQGSNYASKLSVLARDGVRWTQPVASGALALFAQGDGYLGLWSGLVPVSIDQDAVSANSAVIDPDVMVRFGSSDVPSMALCNGRILVPGQTQAGFAEPNHAAIISYDPATGVVSALFDPGHPLADSNGSLLPVSIGCAGERLLVLAGLTVHQYTLSGERGPDVKLATPPATSLGHPVFTQLETRGDHVLVASSGPTQNVLDVLLFYADGTNRAFELPLAPNAAPLVALAVAPDRADGWLRVLYQSGQETAYALGKGYVYASAYELFD